MQLTRAMIFVKDLSLMTHFYGNILGLTLLEESEGWLEFAAGGVRLALHAIPRSIAGNIEIATPPTPRESTPLKLLFSLRDSASERKRLESLGVTIIDRAWGGYDVVDPEGNIFGIHPE